MLKRKLLPRQSRLLSPYQLEDCLRLLGYLRGRGQTVKFEQRGHHVHFRVRRIETRYYFPIVAVEVVGTLRRWNGTQTAIEDYSISQPDRRFELALIVGITLAILIAVALMLPILISMGTGQIGLGALAIIAVCGLCACITVWYSGWHHPDMDEQVHFLDRLIVRELCLEDD